MSTLYAQSKSERDELADKLNEAKDDLETTGHDQSVSLDDPLLGTISLKDFRGGCREVLTGEVLSLVHLNPDQFLILHQLKTGTDIDIPIESDVLPCQLNDWLHHSWVGWQGMTSDSGRNEGFDDHCTGGLDCPADCELFYTKSLDPNDAQDKKMLPSPWFPWLPPNGEFMVRLLASSVESDQTIKPRASGMISIGNPAHLFYTDNLDVVMGYRKQPENSSDPDTNIARRSHFKMLFDYDMVPAGFDYIYKSGTTYYLRSIELSFQLRSYGGSPYCSISGIPSSNPDLRPYSGSTFVTMKVGYSTSSNGTVQYVTCTSTTPSGKNADANEANQWLWNERNEWNSGYAFHNLGSFHIDEDGFLYFEFIDNNKWTHDWSGPEPFDGLQFYSIKLQSKYSPAEYCESVFPMGGTFCIDNMTGDLVYYHDPNTSTSASCPCADCFRQPVVCVDFCDPLSGERTVDNVIAASARTFADEWQYDPASTGTWDGGSNNTSYGAVPNPVQRGEDAMWRGQREFIYRSRIKSGINGNKIYDNAGVFVDDNDDIAGAFTLYNWRVATNNDPTKWLNASTVTRYAPSGESVEEHDILDIYSAVRLAHANTVPKLVAANAEYETVNFEAFEDRLLWGGNASITTDHAHSGVASYKLDPGGAWTGQLSAIDINQHIVDSGLVVKVWVKRTYGASGTDPEDGSSPSPYTPIRIKIGDHAYTTPSTGRYGTLEENVIHKVAQTGEWVQYQILARDFTQTELLNEEDVQNDLPILIKQNLDDSYDMWVDDIRIQPYDAQMICYVYDRDNLRLLTTFDDQHFGAYYQYNGEGKLVRTLRETERGLKTIAETQYHSTEIKRYDFTPAGPAASISSGFPDFDNMSGKGSLASGSSVQADLMSLHIGPEGPNFDFLKSQEGTLPDFKSLKEFDVQQKLLDRLALPESDALRYIKEIQAIEKEIENLEQQTNDDLSDEGRRQVKVRQEELKEKRKRLVVEKLGISEDEWTSWYQEMRTPEDGSRPNNEE